MGYLMEEIMSLQEGTRYDAKAAEILAQAPDVRDLDQAKFIIQQLFKSGDIPAFTHAKPWLEKYLIGIARMYKEENEKGVKLPDLINQTVHDFDVYLTWVKANRTNENAAKLDNTFNNVWHLDDFKKFLYDLRSGEREADAEKLKNQTYEGNSSYELVPIHSYRELHELFGGTATGDGQSAKGADNINGTGNTAWCHANSERVYNSWVADNAMFFVLANKDWKKIPFDKQSNADNSKDAYGNSLIAILVSLDTGELLHATLRCNHVGVYSSADNQYQTYAELSDIAGFNVKDKVFKWLTEAGCALKDWSKDIYYWDGNQVIPKGVVNVVVNDDVTVINSRDTSYRQSLKSISGKNVTKIGWITFAKCNVLEEVNFPNAEQVEEGAFRGCSKLQSISLPKVTNVQNEAFAQCDNLTSVNLPQVINMSARVFLGCTSLESIDLPKLEYCGDNLFNGCSSLKSVKLPSLKEVGDRIFYGCKNLDVNKCILPLNFSADNGCVIQESTLISVEPYTIYIKNDKITSIESGAISTNIISSLTEVDLPKVTKIEDGEFFRCKSLKKVNLPSITVLAPSLFESCTALQEVNIPNVEYIGSGAFRTCDFMKSINLPNVKEIDKVAFGGCVLLKSVNAPKLEGVDGSAFANCQKLEVINSPQIKFINDRAFAGCIRLHSIELPNVHSINNYAFSGCENLNYIDLPKIVRIGSYAFDGCNNLTLNITSNPLIIWLEDMAFMGAKNLKLGLPFSTKKEVLTYIESPDIYQGFYGFKGTIYSSITGEVLCSYGEIFNEN